MLGEGRFKAIRSGLIRMSYWNGLHPELGVEKENGRPW